METVVVGMSGGVDSSVAAYLLKEAGYRVIGLFMHNWEEKDENGVCCAAEDYEDVVRVCRTLEIPYYSVNFAKEYYDRVFRHFLEEYAVGRTPNPDVLCNREIKFKPFLEHAFRLGADYAATGHYCGIRTIDGKRYLARAADASKEQTYFLNQVPREKFDRILFPLQAMQKAQVREIAQNVGLATAKKKDSTGICFIGERNFRKFLSGYLPATGGEITDAEGRVVGRHCGLMYYTLGQRKGLGIGGDARTGGGRWFVVEKDLSRNRLIVSCGDETPLYKKELFMRGYNAIAPLPDGGFDCLAQVRYRQTPQPARVEPDRDGWKVTFRDAQRAITPGQYCVLYDGLGYLDLCLGGGVIEEVF